MFSSRSDSGRGQTGTTTDLMPEIDSGERSLIRNVDNAFAAT